MEATRIMTSVASNYVTDLETKPYLQSMQYDLNMILVPKAAQELVCMSKLEHRQGQKIYKKQIDICY